MSGPGPAGGGVDAMPRSIPKPAVNQRHAPDSSQPLDGRQLGSAKLGGPRLTARRDHVVVTGATGFIGSHLAEALLDRGHEVVGIDALNGHYPCADKWSNLSGPLARQASSCTGSTWPRPRSGPCWPSDGRVPPGGPAGRAHLLRPRLLRYLHDNVLGTQRLLERCVRARLPRLVFSSSSSVYGDAPSYPVTEESRTRPVSPYGVTKLAAEHLCQAYARLAGSSMAVAILRYFTRLRAPPAARHGLPAVHRGRHGRPVVYGDGRQTREFTYVDDVVRASLLVMMAPVEVEAVNIGGGRRVSLKEALELIGEATGRRLQVDRRPPLPGDARHTGADGRRGEALLGYRPETDPAAGLAAQVAWVSRRQRAATG
jgi:UDP-glucuronate 4-epimerase